MRALEGKVWHLEDFIYDWLLRFLSCCRGLVDLIRLFEHIEWHLRGELILFNLLHHLDILLRFLALQVKEVVQACLAHLRPEYDFFPVGPASAVREWRCVVSSIDTFEMLLRCERFVDQEGVIAAKSENKDTE